MGPANIHALPLDFPLKISTLDSLTPAQLAGLASDAWHASWGPAFVSGPAGGGQRAQSGGEDGSSRRGPARGTNRRCSYKQQLDRRV